MNRVLRDMDVPERHVMKITEQFIMVPWDIDNLRAMLGLAEDCPYYVVVRLRPIHPLFHFPEVDDVADEVEKFAIDGVQKVQKVLGTATTEAQMNIGNPDRPKRQG